MNTISSRLADVLEQEIAVGTELLQNLAAQKQALVAWDVAGLLREIEVREPLLQSFGDLEQRRIELLAETAPASAPMSARRIVASLAEDSPERTRLGDLRERARVLFVRLRSEEWNLHRLMENLSAHLQEAVDSVAVSSSVPLYGETGAPAAQRASAAFIHSKA